MNEVDPTSEMIIAYDPGLVTGWAVMVVNPNGPVSLYYGETKGRYEFYSLVNHAASLGTRVTLVGEKFRCREEAATFTEQLDPFYINGHLDALAQQNGWDFLLQTPTQAKSFGTDDKLKVLGWYAPSEGGHQNDALRHLLTYLAQRRRSPGQPGFEIVNKLAAELT